MPSKPRTNLMLILLACVSAGVLGYFIWLFLAPPASAPSVTEVISTDVQTGVVKGEDFRNLEPFAKLPIVPSNIGRANPFVPLPTMDSGEISGENVNVITELIQNTNGG
jgi:hypothetical protein